MNLSRSAGKVHHPGVITVCAVLALSSLVDSAKAFEAIWINADVNDVGQNQIVNFSEIIKVELGKDGTGTKDLMKMWRSMTPGTIDTTGSSAIAAVKDAVGKVSGEWLAIEPKAGYAQIRVNALQKVLFAYSTGCTVTLLAPSGAQGTIKDATDCKNLKTLVSGQPYKWYLLQTVAGTADAYLNLETVQDVRFTGPPDKCSASIDLASGMSTAVNDAELVKALRTLLNSECKAP